MKTIQTYSSAWQQLTKCGNRRARLVAYCFVGLVYTCADSGMDVVTALYVYHDPLSWTPSIFSLWMSVMNIVQVFGGLFGLHMLRKWNISDVKILFIGLTSMSLKMMSNGLANKTWMMFLSIGFGGLSNMGLSSLRAIVATLGTDEETGQLVSIISIVIGWSPLVSSVLLNNLYIVTLSFHNGITFFFMGIMLLLCIILVLTFWDGDEHVEGNQPDSGQEQYIAEPEYKTWVTNIMDRRDSLILSR